MLAHPVRGGTGWNPVKESKNSYIVIGESYFNSVITLNVFGYF